MQEEKDEDARITGLDELPREILSAARDVGAGEEASRAGTFLQLDESAVFARVSELFEGKLEIMGMREALEKYGWLGEKYFRRLIGGDGDFMDGYFLRIMPGANVELPLQAIMFISKPGLKQRVRNLVIAEKGANARVITGCTLSTNAAQHFGVTEFFVEEGATLNFTMIHSWREDTKVRPVSAALVEDDATFVSNYICMRPARDLKMYPRAICRGRNSRANFNNLLYVTGDSSLDVGSMVKLEGANSKGEIISRTVAMGRSKVIVRGRLVGDNPKSRAHLECRGILQGDAKINAIPELVANSEGAELSHEAAVGKIAEKEIVYLMSRGLSRDEATSAIVRGFLDTSIMGLPKKLDEEIKGIVETTLGKL